MENNVLYQIKTLEKAIVRSFMKDHKCVFSNNMKPPTATQHQIIQYILEHRDEEIYQKDLEKVLNLRRATVSGVLQTMEKNNLIERITDDSDTRIKKVILTKNAKKVFLDSEEKFKRLEKMVVSDIAEEDLDVFMKVITKMRENIKNNTN